MELETEFQKVFEEYGFRRVDHYQQDDFPYERAVYENHELRLCFISDRFHEVVVASPVDCPEDIEWCPLNFYLGMVYETFSPHANVSPSILVEEFQKRYPEIVEDISDEAQRRYYKETFTEEMRRYYG